jgi:hypothetical protein
LQSQQRVLPPSPSCSAMHPAASAIFDPPPVDHARVGGPVRSRIDAPLRPRVDSPSQSNSFNAEQSSAPALAQQFHCLKLEAEQQSQRLTKVEAVLAEVLRGQIRLEALIVKDRGAAVATSAVARSRTLETGSEAWCANPMQGLSAQSS